MDLAELYVINLAVTVAMFVVLAFRAWIEMKNYRLLWEEMTLARQFRKLGGLLKAERDLFLRMEGGAELYEALCEMFRVGEKE